MSNILDTCKGFLYLSRMMLFMAEEISKLRELREQAGLSLRELARQIGEHPSNVSFWETSGKLPRSDVLLSIADVLGVSVEMILGDQPVQPRGPKGRAKRTFEEVSKLPRNQQKKILDVVEALLKA